MLLKAIFIFNNFINIIRVFIMFWVCFLFIVMPFHAYAYLDPGTGSIIIQAILGGLTLTLITGKMYWLKIKDFFVRLNNKVSEKDK